MAFLVSLTLPSNRGQAPAIPLRVKSDLFDSNLIHENMKKKIYNTQSKLRETLKFHKKLPKNEN